MHHYESSIVIVIITIVHFQNLNTAAQDMNISQELIDIIKRTNPVDSTTETPLKIRRIIDFTKNFLKTMNKKYETAVEDSERNDKSDREKQEYSEEKENDNDADVSTKNTIKRRNKHLSNKNNRVYRGTAKTSRDRHSFIHNRKHEGGNKAVELTSRDYDLIAENLKNDENYLDFNLANENEEHEGTIENDEHIEIDENKRNDDNTENDKETIKNNYHDEHHFDVHAIIENQLIEPVNKEKNNEKSEDALTEANPETSQKPHLNLDTFETHETENTKREENNIEQKKYLARPRVKDYLNSNKGLSPKFLKMEEINNIMKFSVIGKDEAMAIENPVDVVIDEDNILNKDEMESPQQIDKLNGFLKQLYRANAKRQGNVMKAEPFDFEEIRNKYIQAKPVKDLTAAFNVAKGFFDLAHRGVESLEKNRQLNMDQMIYT